MLRQRHLRNGLVVVWLSTQIVAIVSSPVAFWLDGDAQAAACGCIHGSSDATCPMHRLPVTSKQVCAIRSSSDRGTLLTAFFAVVGPQPQSATTVAPEPTSRVTPAQCDDTIVRSVTPDPPPPRA
jgi:hypothetical protein